MIIILLTIYVHMNVRVYDNVSIALCAFIVYTSLNSWKINIFYRLLILIFRYVSYVYVNYRGSCVSCYTNVSELFRVKKNFYEFISFDKTN